MPDLSCRTARVWLQAQHELPSEDSRRLYLHLLDCRECYAMRKQYRGVDEAIQQLMGGVGAGPSVRPAVRARLESLREERKHKRTSRPFQRRPVWLSVAAGAIAVLAALLTSQLLPGAGHGPITASAAWRLVRPEIGYPMTLDPTASDHLLAGAWGKVYESWNAGGSWHRLGSLPAGEVVRDLAIDVSHPKRYLVATKHSVYVSPDRGAHWKLSVSGVPGAENMFLAQDLHSPDTFYLGPSTLWKSTDSARTWKRAGDGSIFAPNGIQTLSETPDGHLLTGIWGGGVASSHDGGRSWTRLRSGLASDVMDVITEGNGVFWAATDAGIFHSYDAGLHWKRSGPSFFATSVLGLGGNVLSAGNRSLYRSVDAGKHWQLSMDGLPLAPYVYGLFSDPNHAGRVFASLNSDGIFRSNDWGRHWTAVNTGLPLQATGGADHFILFIRQGALDISNSQGTDPGVLTVERSVKSAALSPDGAAVAYLATWPGGWSVRTLNAGGSAARTILDGSGPLPSRIVWSPDSALLAVERRSSVSVSDLSRPVRTWSLSPTGLFLGWDANAHALMVWDTGRVQLRRWSDGRVVGSRGAVFASPPLPAPDGAHLAFIQDGSLHIGTWRGPGAASVPVASGCHLQDWSDDSSHVLLVCGSRAEEWTATGQLDGSVEVSGRVLWVPGSSSDLLLFQAHGLWRWSPHGSRRLLVPDAAPAAVS